jgi:exodeoxyribonuclease VII small subunit
MVDQPQSPSPHPDALRATVERGTFEEALRGLESVVAILEAGQVPIDDAVHWYEIGIGLSRRCQELLDQAALRVSTLEDVSRTPTRDKKL